MPSQLTRNVFRQLLANEPIFHRACSRRRGLATITNPTHRSRVVRRNGTPRLGRTFFDFGIFNTGRREVRAADFVPGLEKMMELEKMQRLKARLPSPHDVARALAAFCDAKAGRAPVEDNEAALALLSLKYCLEGTAGSSQTDHDVRRILNAAVLGDLAARLGRRTIDVTDAHLQLAALLRSSLADCSDKYHKWQSHMGYCVLLSKSGAPEKALDLQLKFEQSEDVAPESPSVVELPDDVEHDVPQESQLADAGSLGSRSDPFLDVWLSLLISFGKQHNHDRVESVVELMRERNLVAGEPNVAFAMLNLSVTRNDLAGVGHWWRQWRSTKKTSRSGRKAEGRKVSKVLRWCLKSGNLDFGQEIVRELTRTPPSKPIWDAIFVWAAGNGKGVDEIGRMFGVMEKSNAADTDSSRWKRPDISTINSLVKIAIEKDDPYMAERFIALGHDWEIEPDAQTFALQMDYRLNVGDTDGALTAYMNLQATDLSSNDDVPTVNRLIVALCKSGRHDFDSIMNIAADLSDRRARFDPETVSTLALLHLHRDEIHDVTDLLNTHASHYSSTERGGIREAILSYCLDPATPTSRAWDAYSILRQTFDELPRDPRTELISSFFKRERPDMAVHIFNHMRTHSREDSIPTVDTYIAAFMGAAKLHDTESLEVIHNQLKLDFNIDQNTRLRNALIIGYTACDRPSKALNFWDDIVASREGPSYSSIHIALRACERVSFGDLKANEIWQKLRKMDIELDRAMWASYAAAIGGNGDAASAINILQQAEEREGLVVDEFVVGSLFMAMPHEAKQSEVEAWAQEFHPKAWEKLVVMGIAEDEVGRRRVKIDRSVTP